MAISVAKYVNSTPNTSHFLVEPQHILVTHVAQGSSLACAAHISLHPSSCAHDVVVLTLCDSPFLFLLSIFSPVVLFILLALSFFFHDVENKSPVHSR